MANYLQVGGSGNGFNLAASIRTKVYVLTDQNLSDKGITLDFSPSDVTALILVPTGGAKQNYGVDFIVNGSFLTWDGLGLDGVLSAGETLVIYY